MWLLRKRERREEKRDGERGKKNNKKKNKGLSIDCSWLNLGLNFITITAHLNMEALRFASEGEELRTVHILLLHRSFIFISPSTPGRAFLNNSLFFFLSWLLHLSLSPFVFRFFLSASPPPPFSSGGFISILSVHIIDSSCLPLVKMSFIIPCDS